MFNIQSWLVKSLRLLSDSERGQDLTEYALLLTLIAIIVVMAVLFFGNNVSVFFSSLGSTISTLLS